MTRDAAIAIFRNELLPELTRELEEAIRDQRKALEAGEVDPDAMRRGVTPEDAPLLLQVAGEFLEHMKAWKPERASRDDLAFALWELLPALADAAHYLRAHGEDEWATKIEALLDRHWHLGAEGARFAEARGVPNLGPRVMEGDPCSTSR